jgi:hypothetical protein
MSIETRLKKAEQRADIDKPLIVCITLEPDETQAEGIKKYEQEHKVKIDKNNANIVFIKLTI